jgi:hypothetical protein
MESKTAEEIIDNSLNAYQTHLGCPGMYYKNQVAQAMQEFAAQQNAELQDSKDVLWRKLSEFYEAFGCATDITPELLQSVQQTLNENGK